MAIVVSAIQDNFDRNSVNLVGTLPLPLNNGQTWGPNFTHATSDAKCDDQPDGTGVQSGRLYPVTLGGYTGNSLNYGQNQCDMIAYGFFEGTGSEFWEGWICCDAAGQNGYFARLDRLGVSLTLYRVDAGVLTQIASTGLVNVTPLISFSLGLKNAGLASGIGLYSDGNLRTTSAPQTAHAANTRVGVGCSDSVGNTGIFSVTIFHANIPGALL